MPYDSPMMAGGGGNSPAPPENQSPPAEPAKDDAQEYTSVFIPKDALGGEYKVGDTIELTVKDVDPDTGEVEAVCEHGNENEQEPSKPGMNEAIDAMPEE